MKIEGTLRRTIAIIMPGSDFRNRLARPARHRHDPAWSFDQIGDAFARRQRRAHAVMAHRNAVGHGDGAELAGGTSAEATPFLTAWA